ncbi:MAG: hypothetical protein KA715_11830 [Xanthomonadaceae bacterium]|nr:hypothetical protein [Xanthomonadaceae bacterium]
MRFSVVFFSLLGLISSSQAQVFLRTETVQDKTYRVYQATVLVDLKSQSPKDLKVAYGKRDQAYAELKDRVASLANSTVISVTQLATNEKTKNRESNFSQSFENHVNVTASAEIEIKPTREDFTPGYLKTDVEAWVSSINQKIQSISGTTTKGRASTQYLMKDAMTGETLQATQGLPNEMQLRKGLKFIVRIKKSILFNADQSSVLLHNNFYSSDPYLTINRSSKDDLMIQPGLYIASYEYKKRGALYKLKISSDNDNLVLNLIFGNESPYQVNEFIMRTYSNFQEWIEIRPTFYFNPRVIRGE